MLVGNRRTFHYLMAAVAATAAVVALGAPTPASAASRISGCFAYGGSRYSGLSTSVEFQLKNGGWAFLAAGRNVTGRNGCASYNISGRARTYHLRIAARASVPQWRGFFVGATPLYAPWDERSWYLGEGRLSFYVLPPVVPTAPEWGGLTGTWLDEMTGGAGPSCSSSSAMLVACYMDQHGMHGNVVVIPRDSDGDGWLDSQDKYPFNKYYR